MKNSLRIKQHDVTDCGVACLAGICAYYKLFIPVSQIRSHTRTNRKGTTILGLTEAAVHFGLEARGVKAPFDALFKIPLPAIAHVITEASLQHYVLICSITKKRVVIMDPATGNFEKVGHDDFRKTWTGVLVLITPGGDFEKGNRKGSNFQRFQELLRPHRSVMLQAFAGAAAVSLLGLSTAIYVQKIVDFILEEGNIRLLNLLSLIMLVILLLQLTIGMVKTLLAIQTGQHIDARLILGYYRHLFRLPQRFFDTMHAGEIISRLNDAVKIRVFINDVVISLAINTLIVIFSLAIMFLYYWKLALIMLSIVPVYAALFYLNDRINKKWQRRLMEHSAELDTQLVESLQSASTIKKLGLEDDTIDKTEKKFIGLLKTGYTDSIYQLWLVSSAEFLTRLFVIIILWAGSYFVIAHELSPGELLSFYSLISYFTVPAVSLLNANKNIREALIAADRLFEIIDMETEKSDGPLVSDQLENGDIRFSRVQFGYAGNETIFTDLDLLIRKGSRTGIAGQSGSGKSTLASLLLGLYTVSGGKIAINGIDIGYVAKHSLRKLVGIVPQHTDLFSSTITENIAIGDPEPDMKKVLDISERLGITAFAEKLPHGFNTVLTEQGNNLSGGQKQRISLARAIYRDPSILILDEATASLDSCSEKKVRETLQWFNSREKTIIIISHRSSTLMDCDTILVIHEGQLSQQGNHAELLNQEGIFRTMFGNK